MVDYSTTDEQDAFISRLAGSICSTTHVTDGSTHVRNSRPMKVLDMDGNVSIGYNLAQNKQPFDDWSENRDIPFSADIAALEAAGRITPSLFADKAMDVRLTSELVREINATIKEAIETGNEDRLFDIVFLTSRSLEDLDKILDASGIIHVDKVTRVADSGATMVVNGEKHVLYQLSQADDVFLKGIPGLKEDMEKAVKQVIGLSDDDELPNPLAFEPKGIATNVDYREILGHYGEKEGSELDVQIGNAVKAVLENYLQQSPIEKDGKPVFEIIEASAALETKVAAVNKGNGLRSVVQAAQETEYTPSALLYAGDDICKRVGEYVYPGTDYPAFNAIEQVAQEAGIPMTGTIHTLHPASGKLSDPDPQPNLNKAASGMEIEPDITVPTPRDTSDIVVQIGQLAREKAQSALKARYSGRDERTGQPRAAGGGRGV